MRVTPTRVVTLVALTAVICLSALFHSRSLAFDRDSRDCEAAKLAFARRDRNAGVPRRPSDREHDWDVDVDDYSEYNASDWKLAKLLEKSSERDERLDKLALEGKRTWLETIEDEKNEIEGKPKYTPHEDKNNSTKKYAKWQFKPAPSQKDCVAVKPFQKTSQMSTNCSVLLQNDGVVRSCVSRSVLGKLRASAVNKLRHLSSEPPGGAGENSTKRADAFKRAFDAQARKSGWDPKHKGFNATGVHEALSWTQEATATLHVIINEIKQSSGKSRVKMLDIPCGDMAWMSRFLKSRDDIDYTGMDIVPELIDNHKTVFKNYPWKFIEGDIVDMKMPDTYDLIFSRTLLQQLYERDVFNVLQKFSHSNSTYFLTTTSSRNKKNTDLKTDGDNPGRIRPLNLELPPYSLRPPLCLQRDGPPDIDQGWDHFLGLWELPVTQVDNCRLISQFTLRNSDKDIYSCVDWSII